ncbi:uncharacterized protein LOC123876550 [Maniola jurtina]|uniref:uncharacterized protein LOC123876550 n=1 Tax=Maniola jurtina TaxID=191418 RepID=UPI001E68F879|nr:uncharacterized protein LOC123876550 [Maniola jurtina]
MGVSRIRTTAYHPQANGQIERWHRTMKAALMASGATTTWTDELPTVLLGLRTAIRDDNNLSPAMMTYGATLRIPSDFLVPTQSKIEDADYVRRLTETMAAITPTERSPATRSTFVYKDLATCTHVFVRNDTVRSPLTPPYDGPYQVLKRHDKYYQIQLPLRTTVVSLDRLKPAYMLNEEDTGASTEKTSVPTSSRPKSTMETNSPTPAPAPSYVTRSGRVVKKVVRFA